MQTMCPIRDSHSDVAKCQAMDTFWSPEPVTGYRAWSVFRDRVEGFYAVWREPTLHSKCDLANPATKTPHINSLCKCGIYAVKDAGWLAANIPGFANPRVAVGKVELTGRVVEHELGYRAQRGTAVDIGVRTRDGVFRFTDSASVEELFQDPHRAIACHIGPVFPVNTNLSDLLSN